MSYKSNTFKVLRKKKGWSQRDAASEIVLDRKTVQALDKGNKVNAYTAKKVAKAFDLTIEDIFTLDEDEDEGDTQVLLEAKKNKLSLAISKTQYTSEQHRAINHDPKRNLQIIAGAGTGKTEVLALRALYLLTECGLKAPEIVILTFTNKAAEEIRHRFRKLYTDKFGMQPANLDEMFIGTIHAYCLELLHRFDYDYLSYELMDSFETQMFIQRHISKIYTDEIQLKQIEKETNSFTKKSTFATKLKMTSSLFSVLREAKIDKSKIENTDLVKALERYTALMNEYKKLDFSEVLTLIPAKIVSDLEFRKKVINNIKHIIVDEYQDTNYAQEKILNSIVENSNEEIKLTVVGDDDQLIYGWNNAEIDNILQFDQRYNNVDKIFLSKNFRSTPGIIETAYNCVEKVSQRMIKTYTSGSELTYEEGDIVSLTFNDEVDEATYTAKKIKDMYSVVHKNRTLLYSDIAVLCRTKSQINTIIKVFDELEIPYESPVVESISDTEFGSAITGLFHYTAGNISSDELIKMFKNTGLSLSDENIKSAINTINLKKSEWKVTQNHSKRSIQKLYQDFLAELDLDEDKINKLRGNNYGEKSFAFLGQISTFINTFEKVNFGYKPELIYKRFSDLITYHIDDYLEKSEYDKHKISNSVNIMTIHAAKGLEFPVVFMPGMTANKFPIKRKGGLNVFHFINETSFSNPSAFKTPRDEERRLAFVAMTRSEKYLFMSWSPINTQSKMPSTFINELNTCDYVLNDEPRRTLEKAVSRLTTIEKSNHKKEINISEIKPFIECPYKYKLSAEYGFKPVYVEALGFGNIVHHAFAEHVELVSSSPESENYDDKYFENLIDKHFNLPYTTQFDNELKSNLKHSAIERITALHNQRYEALKTVKHIEKEISFTLNSDLRFVGRMDMLRDSKFGKEVIDLKTAYQSQTIDAVKLQLKAYAIGEQESTGEYPTRISAMYADKVKKDSYGNLNAQRGFTLPISEDDLKDTKKQLQKLIEGIEAKHKPKVVKEYKNEKMQKCTNCDFCDYSFICSKSQKLLTKKP